MSIEKNLSQILANIQKLGIAQSENIKIVSACKAQPLEKIEQAFHAGVKAFGANYVNEFLRQKKEVGLPLDWHFIGALQSNKLKSLVGEVSLIHSVSRFSTLLKINKIANTKKINQAVLLQLNLSGEPTKSGFCEADLYDNLSQAFTLANIKICGLMTMPPLGEGLFYFKKLAKIKNKINQEFQPPEPLMFLSMGTSEDYLEAIKQGATHIRLGTVLMGQRNYT